MSVAVSIVFTGLCALVAGGKEPRAEVLLVDARGIGPVSGANLPEHAPTLVAPLESLANAESSAPDRVVAAWPGRGSTVGAAPGLGFGVPEQMGIWDLSGSEVRIKVQGTGPEGVELYAPRDGESPWPGTPRSPDGLDSWRDLRYVPDMARLTGDGRIDPALLADASTAALPPRLAARVLLDSGRVEGGIPSQKAFREGTFEFVGSEGAPRFRQAVTDAIRWSLESTTSAVVVEIVTPGTGRVRRLVLASSGPHELFVSNLPSEMTAADRHSMSDDEMAAMHFGAYYELLKHAPTDRPFPRRYVAPVAGKAGLIGGSLCPPGRFSY